MNDRMISRRPFVPILLVFWSLVGQGLGQSQDQHRYEGHKLYRIQPKTVEQGQALYRLLAKPPKSLQGLDVWNKPSSSLSPVDVSVDPQRSSELERYLHKLDLSYTLVVSDLQRLIERNTKRNSLAKALWRQSIYDSYLNYDEMTEWLTDAVRRCSHCSLQTIGKSYEGRPLRVIKISSPISRLLDEDTERANPGPAKPSVWIDAGIHAREWISHSTALFFIDRLISDHQYDQDVRDMLEAYDWYILPCVNPDGYHFSHTQNRLWRKTRSKFNGTTCMGVDANRNFDFHWGSVGTSESPCTDLYRGPRPFSEPETAAIRDFVDARNGTWKLFVTLHSYGQKFLVPYGYTTDKPRNYKNMMAVGNAASSALEKLYGTKYTVGSASDILYSSSGTTRDWAAGAAQIPYVYTIELRDAGRHGFLLPSNEILTTGAETWEAVKEMVRQINRLEDESEIVDINMEELLIRERD